MSSGRERVKLSEEETRDLLGDNLKVQIATIGPDGAPHLSTLFYVLDDNGRIAFWTYRRSQKVLNLHRDRRISALVEDGTDYFELRGVSISGTAELVEDYDDVVALGSKVASRMVDGADLGEFGEEIVKKQARKRVGVIVVPDKVASWDHRKMS